MGKGQGWVYLSCGQSWLGKGQTPPATAPYWLSDKAWAQLPLPQEGLTQGSVRELIHIRTSVFSSCAAWSRLLKLSVPWFPSL